MHTERPARFLETTHVMPMDDKNTSTHNRADRDRPDAMHDRRIM
ncbi:MAG: hypothetical protein WD425_17360 [Nitrospirales bacterium]